MRLLKLKNDDKKYIQKYTCPYKGLRGCALFEEFAMGCLVVLFFVICFLYR